ncbi:22K protein [Raptor adenovirus 1]|uniref:22K protein n=1 Tax=Raptor adenovirus 1 TaxID=1520002 RepID=F4MI07_9ADEN|nr:22K protein [Raptor adenovirus 1]AEC32102.1 22K protein [Raptor adenovirus 1]
MLSFFHSPVKVVKAAENSQIKGEASQIRSITRRKRRIPGSYANWKQYGGDVKEAIAVVGRQPVCVRRYLIAKGIYIPPSTINYYVNKHFAEENSKFTLF